MTICIWIVIIERGGMDGVVLYTRSSIQWFLVQKKMDLLSFIINPVFSNNKVPPGSKPIIVNIQYNQNSDLKLNFPFNESGNLFILTQCKLFC